MSVWRSAQSAFRRAFGLSPSPSAAVPVSYDDKIAQAHKALKGVARSTNVVQDVDTALKRPLHDLSRLEMLELRKLAHHAYHGIGSVARIEVFSMCFGPDLSYCQEPPRMSPSPQSFGCVPP